MKTSVSVFLFVSCLASVSSHVAAQGYADLDQDGNVDCTDIDLLTAEIASGTNDFFFDLNGDGLVNPDDGLEWLVIAGAINTPSGSPYLIGDANLDTGVDVSDFNIWNINKFLPDRGWCGADFNFDGFTDVSDFNLWNVNKFTFSDNPSVVPEPSAALTGSTTLALILIAARRRKKRCPR